MNCEWKECTIADLGTIITGKTPSTKKSENWDGEIPFVTPKDLKGTKHIFLTERNVTPIGLKSVKGSTLPKGAICVSCIGTIGYVGKTTSNCVSNQQINTIITSEDVNSDYVYYLMKWMWPYFKNYEGQSTVLSILNKTQFSKVKVPFHNKKQQDKIASILSSIDDKIELNNAINENLQQQLKHLYDYWFTQFDFPDENGNPYRSSGGQMVWNDTLKRDIPAGWKVESIIENSLSCPIKPGVQPFEEKDYLATAAVNGTSISSGTLISYESRESRANMQPTTSSVWFAKMKNSIKHLYLNEQMKPIIENTILSTGFCGLQCTEQSFEYIATFVEQSYFETMKDILAHGATQESVNTDDLLGLTLVIPVDTVLEAFHKMTAPLYKQIGQNICENQQLSKMRDWLLPMLMNGQATVAD